VHARLLAGWRPANAIGSPQIGVAVRGGESRRAQPPLSQVQRIYALVDHVEIIHDEANVASGTVPYRLGFHRIETFVTAPGAPAEVGRDVRWRLGAEEFPASPAGALFIRGATQLDG
jgi:hypothetical protein